MNKYYHAIDGLRAVAVGLVLFFHAGFSFARAGFIGVDVFFVISGFLITGLIARDIESQNWSFGRFYLRRIVRLTPALLVTVIATLVASYFILAPDDLARLGRTGLYSALSVSNFFFWMEAGYFDQAASSKPLLHTWSLGVEEQFYLVWPAIIFLLTRWRGRQGAALGLAVLGAISIIFALVFNKANPDAVFFLMPFRVYQFALGGLVALLLTTRDDHARSLAGIGAVAVLLVTMGFSEGGGEYWFNAVLPAFAAALFIWSSEARLVRIIFASTPMVWLGQRSYSIYLVHWPIMVLWPMATDFELSILDGVIAIVISVIFGAILHSAVEKPLRFKKSMAREQRNRSIGVTVFLLISCLTVGAHIWGLQGIPGRIPAEIREVASNIGPRWEKRKRFLRNKTCNFTENVDVRNFKPKICANPPRDKRSYMVIGDSHGSGAYMFLRKAYPDVYFGQLTVPGCSLKMPDNKNSVQKRKWCEKFYKLAFESAVKNHFDGVVFAAFWRDFHKEEIENFITWANDNNLDSVFMSSRPEFKERVPTIILSSIHREQAQRRAQSLLRKFHKDQAANMTRRLSSRTKIVNLYDVMCDDVCPIFDEQGQLIYLDGHHLSLEGAEWLGARLNEKYPGLFQENRHSD